MSEKIAEVSAAVAASDALRAKVPSRGFIDALFGGAKAPSRAGETWSARDLEVALEARMRELERAADDTATKESDEELKKVTRDLEAMRGLLAARDAAVADSEAKRTCLEASLEAKSRDLGALEAIKIEAAETRARLEEKEAALAEARAALAEAESSTAATTRAFAVAEQEIGEALRQVQILRSERETAEAEVERLNATLASVEDAKLEEIRALEKKLASAESSTNATTRAFAVAEQEIGEALTQVQILRSERETAEAEVERLRSTLASTEDASRSDADALATAEAKLAALTADGRVLSGRADALEAAEAALREKEAAMRADAADARALLEEKDKALAEARVALAAAEASASMSEKAFESQLRETREGVGQVLAAEAAAEKLRAELDDAKRAIAAAAAAAEARGVASAASEAETARAAAAAETNAMRTEAMRLAAALAEKEAQLELATRGGAAAGAKTLASWTSSLLAGFRRGASSEGAASEPLSARLSALLTTKTAALRSDFDGVDGADEIEAALGAVGDAAAEVAALERNLAASREDAERAAREAKDAAAARASAEEKLAAAATSDAAAEAARRDVLSLTKRLADAEAASATARDAALADSKRATDALEADVARLKAESDELRARFGAAASAKEREIASVREALEEELEAAKTAAESLADDKLAIQTELAKKIEELRSDYVGATTAAETLAEEKLSLRAALEEKEDALRDALARADRLAGERDAADERKGFFERLASKFEKKVDETLASKAKEVRELESQLAEARVLAAGRDLEREKAAASEAARLNDEIARLRAAADARAANAAEEVEVAEAMLRSLEEAAEERERELKLQIDKITIELTELRATARDADDAGFKKGGTVIVKKKDKAITRADLDELSAQLDAADEALEAERERAAALEEELDAAFLKYVLGEDKLGRQRGGAPLAGHRPREPARDAACYRHRGRGRREAPRGGRSPQGGARGEVRVAERRADARRGGAGDDEEREKRPRRFVRIRRRRGEKSARDDDADGEGGDVAAAALADRARERERAHVHGEVPEGRHADREEKQNRRVRVWPVDAERARRRQG